MKTKVTRVVKIMFTLTIELCQATLLPDVYTCYHEIYCLDVASDRVVYY